MPRLNQYSAILIAVSVLIGYMIMYQYTDITTSKFIADWIAMIGLSFMSFSTLPVAWRAFRNGISTDRDMFIFSYWLIWTIVLWQRIWIILLASFDRPVSWAQSPVSGLMATSIAIAAGFGASAPLAGEVPLHRKEIIIFAIAAGFSGVIAGIAIGVYLVAGWVD